ARRVDVWVHQRAAEGVQPFDTEACALVHFPDTATLPRTVKKTVCQSCVVYGFPEITGGTGCKPVGIAGPHFDQHAVLPCVLVLVPALAAESRIAVSAIFRFHVH